MTAAALLQPDLAPARIRALTLTNFRSYAAMSASFDGRPAAISGANGAGKTNILEALSLLGPGRGIRSARLDELPRLGGDGGWAVSAKVDDGEDERRFGVGALAAKPERRICRIDDSAASGPGALAEYLRFVWLTPAQDRLFMDGAGDRRRFVDRMALAHMPKHASASSRYEQAMRQRQRLLEDGRRDDAWLSGIESQMAEAGVAVASARCKLIEILRSTQAVASDSHFPMAELSLSGRVEEALQDASDETVEAQYREELARVRYRDADAGRALTGPHRSDLAVAHREKDQPARLCSTGEQKALLIGVVLANARALSDNRAPLILLLDEIAAHLDPDRRAALFDILDALDCQTFMTGTDRELFSAWGERAQHLEVCEGDLRNIA